MPRLFPPITSDTTRAEYKKVFNDEYQEYLNLKGQVEVVRKEVTALSDQMTAVDKGTEEARVKRREIEKFFVFLVWVVKCVDLWCGGSVKSVVLAWRVY